MNSLNITRGGSRSVVRKFFSITIACRNDRLGEIVIPPGNGGIQFFLEDIMLKDSGQKHAGMTEWVKLSSTRDVGSSSSKIKKIIDPNQKHVGMTD